MNKNEEPKNRPPKTKIGVYQKLTASTFAKEHYKPENPWNPS
jgi:hypothetical protein